MLNLEWQLLFTACSLKPLEEKHSLLSALLKQQPSFQRLFRLANEHGVQPLLCHALEAVENEIPAEEMTALKESWQSNVRKSLLVASELIRILQHLSERDIEVIPYKGVALAEAVYGDLALRQSGDIDLLIRAKDFARARDALRDLGYAPQELLSHAADRAYLTSGYECVFDGAMGRNFLEVKWAILPRFYAIDFHIDDLFQRAVTVSVAGQRMKTLSTADLLLVLAVHAAKHGWERLIWICDLARLVSLAELDWEWIRGETKRLGIMRILSISMLLAKRLLDAEIPAAVSSFPPDAKAEAITEDVLKQITSGVEHNIDSTAYFRFQMRLRERPADRLRFLERFILTPGPGEWESVRLPEPLFPLYRLVRLSRLAARAIRI